MLKNLITLSAKYLWAGLRLILLGSFWCLGLSLILLFPIRGLTRDYFSPVRFINYLLPWGLLLLFPAVFIAAIAHRKRLLVILIVPALAICFNYAPLFLPHQNPSLKSDTFSLKIMSHNLFFKHNAADILVLLRQQQPDIVLFQELHPDLISIPRDDLADLYPELHTAIVNQPENGFIQAILSRYPITPLAAEFDHGRAQKVRIDTPAGPVIVWNVHLIPPFRISSQWHDQQIHNLTADLKTMNAPLIVGGDFNATDQSATYQAISQYLKDTHRMAGYGFGFTFPAPPHKIEELPINTGLLYRIDYIFCSDHFIVHDAHTLTTSAGSDHLPITAILSFAN